jgi:hypothetical protein
MLIGDHLMMVWFWVDSIATKYGAEAAKEVALFQRDQVYAMKSVAKKEKLVCNAVLTRCFEVVLDQGPGDRASRVYQKQLDDRLGFIKDVNYVGLKYVERVS